MAKQTDPQTKPQLDPQARATVLNGWIVGLCAIIAALIAGFFLLQSNQLVRTISSTATADTSSQNQTVAVASIPQSTYTAYPTYTPYPPPLTLPPPTPGVQTVIVQQTVPVEVTKLVVVTNIVEVTPQPAGASTATPTGKVTTKVGDVIYTVDHVEIQRDVWTFWIAANNLGDDFKDYVCYGSCTLLDEAGGQFSNIETVWGTETSNPGTSLTITFRANTRTLFGVKFKGLSSNTKLIQSLDVSGSYTPALCRLSNIPIPYPQ